MRTSARLAKFSAGGASLTLVAHYQNGSLDSAEIQFSKGKSVDKVHVNRRTVFSSRTLHEAIVEYEERVQYIIKSILNDK